ncbi:hypothetical protein Fmac_002988 [Flemingia macrophylla]|uniref:Rhamnogalacturonan endolyase n=1 Tax=Flemingia macrophylla TaxID=520843 RepID=A0ABD1NLH7_9FABA
MAVQLSIIMLGACSERLTFRRFLASPTTPPVKLNTKIPQQVVIENGVVSVNLSNPEGYIIQLYTGKHGVLDNKNKETDRGYFDVVWNDPSSKAGMFERYILRRGDSGFYSYIIFNRPPGFPRVVVDQIRIVYKLDENRFHYMAISDNRQRYMPTAQDRSMGQELAYKEAVLLNHPSESQFKGEVDDKYEYSIENKDNKVHGWISNDPSPVGFWLITPSNEFRNAGPVKQDLTSHVGPTTLSMFVSTHYVGKDAEISFAEGETYTKVFGPVFVYLNTVSNKQQFRSLWSDAVGQLEDGLMISLDQKISFHPINGEQWQECYESKMGGKDQPASSAYVGLAMPGYAGSWQTESKGYQFWNQADKEGHFLIKNIVPGVYNLYAWVPGFIGDYKYATKITIKPGDNINLNSIVYNPPRNGPTLWEIGSPDRSAAEFYIPDPNPMFRNRLYSDNGPDKFRQYGLWDRYSELFPDHDLVYTAGVDDYRKNWFFAHVNRKTNNTYVATTWQIQFQLQNIIPGGNYTLQLALASANNARVLVRFNDPNRPYYFSTGLIGEDNAIARHGIHGLYRLYTIVVGCNQLVKGKNVIYLTQSRATDPFEGVMYDYIRLEGPSKY